MFFLMGIDWIACSVSLFKHGLAPCCMLICTAFMPCTLERYVAQAKHLGLAAGATLEKARTALEESFCSSGGPKTVYVQPENVVAKMKELRALAIKMHSDAVAEAEAEARRIESEFQTALQTFSKSEMVQRFGLDRYFNHWKESNTTSGATFTLTTSSRGWNVDSGIAEAARRCGLFAQRVMDIPTDLLMHACPTVLIAASAATGTPALEGALPAAKRELVKARRRKEAQEVQQMKEMEEERRREEAEAAERLAEQISITKKAGAKQEPWDIRGEWCINSKEADNYDQGMCDGYTMSFSGDCKTKMMGQFDFGFLVGYLKMKRATVSAANPTSAVRWVGREQGEGESCYGEDHKGEITFTESGRRLQGWWDGAYGKIVFDGWLVKALLDVRMKQTPDALRSAFNEFNDRRSNYERQARWGGWHHYEEEEEEDGEDRVQSSSCDDGDGGGGSAAAQKKKKHRKSDKKF